MGLSSFVIDIFIFNPIFSSAMLAKTMLVGIFSFSIADILDSRIPWLNSGRISFRAGKLNEPVLISCRSVILFMLNFSKVFLSAGNLAIKDLMSFGKGAKTKSPIDNGGIML